MAALDILKEAGKSMIGMVTKAVLEIEDNRVKDVEISEMGGFYGIKSNLTETIRLVSKANLQEAVSDMKVQAKNAAGVTKRFTVRFNPNELSLQAQGGGRVVKTNFSDGSGNPVAEYGEMTPRIQLSVKLVFDSMSGEDAFMSEKIKPEGLVRDVITTGVNAVRKKELSVKPQVEGLIAALRNPYTRNITFHWGTLSYSGVLNNLKAEYTMFSISGKPIRANVVLGILCVDDLKQGNMGRWQEFYDKAFSVSDVTNLEGIGQNIGNLFHINL